MMQNDVGERIDRILGDDYAIAPFRDLPEPYRMALAWYMAIDGEAWADVLSNMGSGPFDAEEWKVFAKATISERLPAFDARYGDVPFGFASVKTDVMLTAMLEDDFATEQALTADGLRSLVIPGGVDEDYPSHPPTDRWPVVLSSFDTETIQDGCHRFGCYVRDGHPDIPVLFYPARRHLLDKGLSPEAEWRGTENGRAPIAP